MGTAYTPGLKVSPHTLIQRTRRLPLKGDVLVETGQIVSPDTVVARASLPGLMQSVKVAAQLGIDADELPGALLVKEGDEVEKGQVIAATKAFFGMFKSETKSPVTGRVETISAVSGNVGVRQPPLPINLTAYLSGTVAETMPGEGVIVQTEGALIQGIFGIGGERVGEILMVSTSPESDLTEAEITPALAARSSSAARTFRARPCEKPPRSGSKASSSAALLTRTSSPFSATTSGSPSPATRTSRSPWSSPRASAPSPWPGGPSSCCARWKASPPRSMARPRSARASSAPRSSSPSAHSPAAWRPAMKTKATYLSGHLFVSSANPTSASWRPSPACHPSSPSSGQVPRSGVLEATLADGSVVTVPRANVEIIEG